MKAKIVFLLFFFSSCAGISAQGFKGIVKTADSIPTPVFQASVEVTEGGKPFKILKTYFDGSFKFNTNKSQVYVVKISYSGYKDTSYTITSDAKGTLSAQNVTVLLKKDGMRLVGVIKNREENFPIKGATIVLKNVMTRQEDRLTTSIDGRYNFKLEYETNYRISIDKFSPGIFNKYKDTAFYISTIGFNQPLNYKLDITLDELLYPVNAPREGYNSSRKATNKVKPVIEVTAMKEDFTDSVQATIFPEQEQKSVLGTGVMSKEDSISLTSSDIDTLNFKSNAEVQKWKTDSIERENAAKELAVKRAHEDSVTKVSVAVRTKFIQDSLSQVRAELAEREKAKQDSIVRAKEEQEKIVRELTIKKAYEDSIRKATIAVRTKFIQDSLSQLRAELTEKTKAKQDSITRAKMEQLRVAKELAMKKAYDDSVRQAAMAIRAKFVQDSLNQVKAELAEKAKARQDSIVRVKMEQQRIVKELARQKIYQDSVNKALAAARIKFVHDSTIRATVAARIKFIQDSVSKAFAEFVAKEKAEKDSIANLKAEREKVAKESAAKQAQEDSVKKFLIMATEKFFQDSLRKANAKIEEDSIIQQRFFSNDKSSKTNKSKELKEKKEMQGAFHKGD